MPDPVTVLARKWTDGCPHIYPEWDESKSAPLCCLKAAVREALEEQLQALERMPLEYPTEPAAVALSRMITALRGG